MDLREQVEEMSDRHAVEEVLHRYCECVDGRLFAELTTEVFAEDAEDHHGEKSVKGRDALAKWFADAVSPLAATVHAVSNVRVKIDGDKATMDSVFASWAWTFASEGQGSMRPADYALIGAYHHELTRYDVGWRIDRQTVLTNGTSNVLVGSVPATQRHAHVAASRH